MLLPMSQSLFSGSLLTSPRGLLHILDCISSERITVDRKMVVNRDLFADDVFPAQLTQLTDQT